MQELKQRLASPPAELAPAERVVRALLDDYPRLGLGPMTRLARHAGVSDPTIMRLVKSSASPATATSRKRCWPTSTTACARRAPCSPNAASGWAATTPGRATSTRLARACNRPSACPMTSSASPTGCSTAACACHGGRFSRFLAGYLVTHLRLLRPQCRLLDDGALLPDQLYDLGRQDLLVLFDYRRYQSQAQHVAQAAKARGTRLVLFTDIYASPLRGAPT